MRKKREKKEKKEYVINVAGITSLYVFFKLFIETLELYEWTGMNVDAISDVMREPWEEDRHIRFIGVSKAGDAIKKKLQMVTDMFEDVKEFQARCGNEFTWSIEP